MTVNALDIIVDKINELAPLVEIRKDAWVEEEGISTVPDNYGVLTMTGNVGLWADNHLIEETVNMTLQIWLKPGTEEGFRDTINGKLGELADTLDITWTFPQRSYDFEVDLTAWQWTITRYGPVEWEEPDED